MPWGWPLGDSRDLVKGLQASQEETAGRQTTHAKTLTYWVRFTWSFKTFLILIGNSPPYWWSQKLNTETWELSPTFSGRVVSNKISQLSKWKTLLDHFPYIIDIRQGFCGVNVCFICRHLKMVASTEAWVLYSPERISETIKSLMPFFFNRKKVPKVGGKCAPPNNKNRADIKRESSGISDSTQELGNIVKSKGHSNITSLVSAPLHLR